MSDNLQDVVFDDHPAAGFRPAVAAIIARAVEQACEEILQLCARETAKALMPGTGEQRGEPQPVWDDTGRYRGYGTIATARKAASGHLDATGAAT